MDIVEGIFKRRDLLKNSKIAISWQNQEEAQRIGEVSRSVEEQARRIIHLSMRLFASQWGDFDPSRRSPEYPSSFHDLVSFVSAHAFQSKWILDSRRKQLNEELEKQINGVMGLQQGKSSQEETPPETKLPILFPSGYIPRARLHLAERQQEHFLKEDTQNQQVKIQSFLEYCSQDPTNPKMRKMADFLSISATVFNNTLLTKLNRK